MNIIEVNTSDIKLNLLCNYSDIIWDYRKDGVLGAEEALDTFTNILDSIDRGEYREMFARGHSECMLSSDNIVEIKDATSNINIIIIDDKGNIIDTVADDNCIM